MLDEYYKDQFRSLGTLIAGIVTGIVIGSLPFIVVVLVTQSAR